jgi:Ring finger domain
MTSTPALPVVDDCVYSQGAPAGREVTCLICLEDMEVNEKTVTHCKCNNAFHVSCFDELFADANPQNPTGANSAEINPIKCPLCRGELKPRPKAGCALPPALSSGGDCARFHAALQSAETIFFNTIFFSREDEIDGEQEALDAAEDIHQEIHANIHEQGRTRELMANLEQARELINRMYTEDRARRLRQIAAPQAARSLIIVDDYSNDDQNDYQSDDQDDD